MDSWPIDDGQQTWLEAALDSRNWKSDFPVVLCQFTPHLFITNASSLRIYLLWNPVHSASTYSEILFTPHLFTVNASSLRIYLSRMRVHYVPIYGEILFTPHLFTLNASSFHIYLLWNPVHPASIYLECQFPGIWYCCLILLSEFWHVKFIAACICDGQIQRFNCSVWNLNPSIYFEFIGFFVKHVAGGETFSKTLLWHTLCMSILLWSVSGTVWGLCLNALLYIYI